MCLTEVHGTMSAEQVDEQALLRLVEKDDLNTYGHRKLAELYLSQGKVVKALKHFRTVVFAVPDDLEVREIVATLAFKVNNFEESLTELEHLVQKDSDAAVRVVEHWRKQGYVTENDEQFSTILEGCRLTGNLKGEAELLRNIPFENRTRQQGLRIGSLYLLTGQTSSALGALKKVPVKNDLLGVQTVITTAEALAESGLSVMAYEKLDEIRLELYSFTREDLAESGYRMGRLYETIGMPDQALKHFKITIKEKILHQDALKRAQALLKEVSGEDQDASREKVDEISVIPPTFKNIKLLGRGGMGAVYSAFDPIQGETVAIKVISAFRQGDARTIDLFMREAATMQVLSHPNVLKVYRVHRGTYPYMVLEYLDGENLRSILIKKSSLPATQVKYIATQVTMALHYAQSKGIVHRDLKPDNIMLTSTGQVKVMDFGLAEARGSLKVDEGTIAGTIYYMSPEQLKGEPTDVRSDIYSFGVTLFELLSGLKPFPDGDIRYRHISDTPVFPVSVKQTLPAFMEEVVMRCLEKLPARRYQSWHAVLQDLRSEKKRGYRYLGYEKREAERTDGDVRDDEDFGEAVAVEDIIDVTGVLPARFKQPKSCGTRGVFEEFKALDGTRECEVRVFKLSYENMPDKKMISDVPPWPWMSRYQKRLSAATGDTHASLLQVYEVINEEDATFIATEGADWYRISDRRIPTISNWNETMWTLAVSIGQALAWLHKHNVVHGALNETEIFTDGQGTFKLGLIAFPGADKNKESDLSDLGELVLRYAGDSVEADSSVKRGCERAAGVQGEPLSDMKEFLQALAFSEEVGALRTARKLKSRKYHPLRLFILVCVLLGSIAALAVIYKRQIDRETPAGTLMVETEQGDLGRYYYQGLEFLKAQALDEAAASFLKALEDHPDCHEARFELARLVFARGDPEQTLPLLQSLVDAGHRWEDVKPMLGETLIQSAQNANKRGDYREAIAIIGKVRAHEFQDERLEPLTIKAYGSLADNMLSRGAFKEASGLYLRVQEVKEQGKEFYIKLGKCYAGLGDDRKADDYYRKYLKMGGTRQELRRAVYGRTVDE